jgi:hypothetical protein
MEPTDATIIGVYFLDYIKSISTCFGHYYAHHQETRKRDWLTLHVKLPGCGGCSCMELRCGQCALLESCCQSSNSFLKAITVASVGSIIYLINDARSHILETVQTQQQLQDGGAPEYVYHDRTVWPCAVFVGKKYGSKGYPQRNVSRNV